MFTFLLRLLSLEQFLEKTTVFITLDIGAITISFLAVFVFKLKETKLIMIQTLTLKHKHAH